MKNKLIFGMKKPHVKLFVILSFISISILVMVARVRAWQSDGIWANPVNVSQTSGTRIPQLVVDWQGVAHLLWINEANGFTYSAGDGEIWSSPDVIELPFGTRRYDLTLEVEDETPLYVPRLFADQIGNIHASWLDEDLSLFYSRVEADQFFEFESWSAPQQLAEAALDMQIAADGPNIRHLAYIRPISSLQFPAGIYYRQSRDNGSSWTPPTLLHESAYFQTLDSSQVNIQVVSASPNDIVVAWEDQIQEKIRLIHSGNRGVSWDPVIIMDQREKDDARDSFGPGMMAMASRGDSIHIIWQAGHKGANCDRYHQYSSDGGSTWQPIIEANKDVSDCSERLWLSVDADLDVLLIDDTVGGTYISIWDGRNWSNPSHERILSTFTNPETYRTVELDCFEADIGGDGALFSPYKLIVTGCEKNRDVWSISADLTDLKERIAPKVEPAWQPLKLLTSVGQGNSLATTADTSGNLHAFWTLGGSPEISEREIYYSRWDGESWSSQRPVLKSTDADSAELPSVTFDPPDELKVVWVASNPGALLFARAKSSLAATETEWSLPVRLPLPREAATSPQIAVGENDILHVAYAIPLNEERGIYLVTSLDGGENWLESTIVFDAATAGWDMVDNPRITVAADGTLHLMWIRYGSPPVSEAISLHYSTSRDGGLSWSESILVAESNILWAEPLAVGNQLVHRLWYVEDSGVWHDISIDSGQSWDLVQRLPGTIDDIQAIDATLDGAGQPHVLAIEIELNQDEEREAIVRHWIRSEDRWKIEESQVVIGTRIEGLDTAITTDNNLVLLYGSLFDNEESDGFTKDIFSTYRKIDLPSVSPTPIPTQTPLPLPQPTTMPTQTPVPTPTVFFPLERDDLDGLPIHIDTSNPLVGPLVGIIPAALLIFVAFFIVVRIVRSGRR